MSDDIDIQQALDDLVRRSDSLGRPDLPSPANLAGTLGTFEEPCGPSWTPKAQTWLVGVPELLLVGRRTARSS